MLQLPLLVLPILHNKYIVFEQLLFLLDAVELHENSAWIQRLIADWNDLSHFLDVSVLKSVKQLQRRFCQDGNGLQVAQ
jgi:hypothetical protein